MTLTDTDVVRGFDELGRDDVAFAGGKGANLGELVLAGVPVPDGFVVGAPAYATFCEETGVRARLVRAMAGLDPDDSAALVRAAEAAREILDQAPTPAWLRDSIIEAYRELGDDVSVAVRSSATAEDTGSTSFAGMNRTLLNVSGAEDLIVAVRACWTSLFGARTVFYRANEGLPQAEMDIAVVVQAQIESTRAGVMFTIDPSSGRTDRLVIEGAFGLGESVVSGSVSPDRYVVDKATRAVLTSDVRHKELVIESAPGGGTVTRAVEGAEATRRVLIDEEVRTLADLGITIEEHYGSAQDTEWAFDAGGRVWMLQSRPVTASGGDGTPMSDDDTVPIDDDAAGAAPLVRGLGAAPGIGSGVVRLVTDLAGDPEFNDGDVLVTHMTTPDWVPLLRRAAAVVTDTGGMTCHAAIVSRELGVPCLVGTGDATQKLRDGEAVTVDAGRGMVLPGRPARYELAVVGHGAVQPLPPQPAHVTTGTKVLVNMSEPSQVARVSALDADGVGLLRAELMVLETLGGVHPRLLLERGQGSEVSEAMADAIETFAVAFAPRPITYRTIDFRTNEFRGLEGGERFEPVEANPMIGLRGAARYVRDPEVFNLELDAFQILWDRGHTNVHMMLPFVRTAGELKQCVALIDQRGLMQRRGFQLWVMAEVPSVLFNLERYARLGIAGISIGTNDLTQLLLGVDRDSDLLADTFDERDPAVVEYVQQLIARAGALGLQTSICGQAPSVHPEYTDLLVRAGIDAISVNADVVDQTRRLVASAEQRLLLKAARTHSTPRQ